LCVPITILSTTQDTIVLESVLESAASGKTVIRTLPENPTFDRRGVRALAH